MGLNQKDRKALRERKLIEKRNKRHIEKMEMKKAIDKDEPDDLVNKEKMKERYL